MLTAPALASHDTGDHVEPTRPRRRSIREAIRQIPGDWLFERASGPNLVIGVAVLVGTLMGGLSAGTALAIHYLATKIPFTANAISAVWHRDITRWTRPQSHQRRDVADQPLPPMETDPDAKGVPGWLRWLTRTANRDDLGRSRTGALRFVDDWLNQRSRVPGVIIEAAVLIFGFVVMPIPWVFLFPINTVVTGVPTMLALYLAVRNHDVMRFTRGGMRQRDEVRGSLTRRALAGRGVHLRPIPHAEIETPGAIPLPARAAPVRVTPAPAHQRPAVGILDL